MRWVKPKLHEKVDRRRDACPVQSCHGSRRRPDEKKLILGGVANLESEEALEFVEQYLEDEEVREEAQRAYERIADALED